MALKEDIEINGKLINVVHEIIGKHGRGFKSASVFAHAIMCGINLILDAGRSNFRRAGRSEHEVVRAILLGIEHQWVTINSLHTDNKRETK